MRRRDFVAAAAVLPLVATLPARAQAGSKLVAAMIGAGGPADPSGIEWLDAIRQGLAAEGWIDGGTVRIEVRFTAGRPDLSVAYAAELAALGPDAFLCGTTQNAVNAHAIAPDVPLVFVAVPDPIGAGLVQSISHPGGMVTGISHYAPEVGGKLVSLLLEMAPSLRRLGYIHNPDTGSVSSELFRPHIMAAAVLLGVDIIDTPVRGLEEVGPAIDTIAALPDAGLIVPVNNWILSNRAVFVEAVARNRLPAIWGFGNVDGGLISYYVDTTRAFLEGAVYVGQILRGASPANLPVRSAPRYLLTVDLGTAAALGLHVPPVIFATADRIFE